METINSSLYSTNHVNALPPHYGEKKLSMFFRICALTLITVPILFFSYLLYSVEPRIPYILKSYDGLGFIIFLAFVGYILITGLLLLGTLIIKIFKKPAKPYYYSWMYYADKAERRAGTFALSSMVVMIIMFLVIYTRTIKFDKQYINVYMLESMFAFAVQYRVIVNILLAKRVNRDEWLNRAIVFINLFIFVLFVIYSR